MREIYKFHIRLTDNVMQLNIDSSSTCLAFQRQGNELMLWVEVWQKEIVKPLKVRVFGTGWENIPQDAIYVGTAQFDSYVWHLYREPHKP